MAEDPSDSLNDSDFRYYPYRRSGKTDPTWKEKLFNEVPASELWKQKCEKNVSDVFKISPVVRILRAALEKAGCSVNLKRHVICELCSDNVHGGYDGEYNQIVICKNTYKSRNYPEAVLVHELIHMYDNCVNEFNPRNLEHLACTEIRAANLTHCSFISSMYLGTSSPFNVKQTHQDCVKRLAINSIMASRNVDLKTATTCVMKVFDRCYNDLEPIGRRFRRKSEEALMAEEEAKHLIFEKND